MYLILKISFLEPTMRVGNEFQAEVPDFIKGFYDDLYCK